MKSTIVVSDTHLGSRHCRVEAFLRFLDHLPADAALVLNGDTLDHWRKLPALHAQALARLKAESLRGRDVIWLAGNNDADYRLPDPGNIRFMPRLVLEAEQRICIAHGDEFDRLLHGSILFTLPFRIVHGLRQLVGRPSVHVAQYARRWTRIYNFLKGRIVRNAVSYACENGFSVIVCGHTHHAEDITVDGIRYLNTGAWTEEANHFVEIAGGHVALRSATTGSDGEQEREKRGKRSCEG